MATEIVIHLKIIMQLSAGLPTSAKQSYYFHRYTKLGNKEHTFRIDTPKIKFKCNCLW